MVKVNTLINQGIKVRGVINAARCFVSIKFALNDSISISIILGCPLFDEGTVVLKEVRLTVSL